MFTLDRYTNQLSDYNTDVPKASAMRQVLIASPVRDLIIDAGYQT